MKRIFAKAVIATFVAACLCDLSQAAPSGAPPRPAGSKLVRATPGEPAARHASREHMPGKKAKGKAKSAPGKREQQQDARLETPKTGGQ